DEHDGGPRGGHDPVARQRLCRGLAGCDRTDSERRVPEQGSDEQENYTESKHASHQPHLLSRPQVSMGTAQDPKTSGTNCGTFCKSVRLTAPQRRQIEGGGVSEGGPGSAPGGSGG